MFVGEEDKPSLATLAHFGVKGMRWGVRKSYRNYQNKVLKATPGATETSVTTKTGEKISVVKEKPGPLALAIGKLTGRDLGSYVASMAIHDSTGKKVGSFQMWKDGPSTVRGEWLEIHKDSQGKGYSKAAIKGLMLAAEKDLSLKEVRLQVPSEAGPAKHIYSSLGFKKDKDLGFAPGFGDIEDWVYHVR